MEDVEVVGKGEEGFVNVAHRGSGTMSKDGAAPAPVRVPEFECAVGMKMDGHCPSLELEVLVQQGPIAVVRIPAEIEGRIIHRVVGDIGIGVSIDHGGEADLPVHYGDFLKPQVSHFVTFALPSQVEVGHPPEAAFLDRPGIVDHAPADFGGWSIDSAYHQEVGLRQVHDGDVPAKVGIGDLSGDVVAFDPEEAEFGINRGFIAPRVGRKGPFFQLVRWNCLGSPGDLGGDSPHGDEDPTINGDWLPKAVCPILSFPPFTGIKDPAERITDLLFELLAGDFLGGGHGQAHEVFPGDGTRLRIVLGQRF